MSNNIFNTKDLTQIKDRGSDLQTVEKQIENFKKGFPFSNLQKAATIGDGILKLKEPELETLKTYFDKESQSKKVLKFIPASGAASRMFKSLFNYLKESKNGEKSKDELFTDKSFNSVYNFVSNITNFAFYNSLKAAMEKEGKIIESILQDEEYSVIIDYLLNEHGLDYGSLPKGLLEFHRYFDASRLAMEEHLVEGAFYSKSENNIALLHFTVSPEHLEKFKEQLNRVIKKYEEKFGITYAVKFSMQKASTDTIAVDMENKPFREKDGSLLFRPGGHGALIENLNDLEADVIFIKNIDNIVPDRLKETTILYKKAIGGLLLKLQATTFKYLNELKNNNDAGSLDQITEFAQTDLNINIPPDFYNKTNDEKKEFLFEYLNRPIRICGMVKNEGEPGGGPFWVKNTKGETSLQIVESSQVDSNDPDQLNIMKSATHFNPVDLVCGIKNYKNEKFDLHQYIDPETGFISIKSKDGKNLKAQELPGLWNGAMANWNTVFVEVPIITFNPVKTVNDLLREQHQ
jgi:hypothetical protein